ncbi:hypothetical protein MMC06_000066 [Schaereria dolodes]|nr:hypothetical protein [Schaereria dolodes]
MVPGWCIECSQMVKQQLETGGYMVDLSKIKPATPLGAPLVANLSAQQSEKPHELTYASQIPLTVSHQPSNMTGPEYQPELPASNAPQSPQSAPGRHSRHSTTQTVSTSPHDESLPASTQITTQPHSLQSRTSISFLLGPNVDISRTGPTSAGSLKEDVSDMSSRDPRRPRHQAQDQSDTPKHGLFLITKETFRDYL